MPRVPSPVAGQSSQCWGSIEPEPSSSQCAAGHRGQESREARLIHEAPRAETATIVRPRVRFFHRGTSAPIQMSDRDRPSRHRTVLQGGGLAPLAEPESSELPEPGSSSIASARFNDAWPALIRMMASIPPPPGLTPEETNELFNTVGPVLAELSRRLSAPRSWKERWLPRCLRTRPKPDKNAILKWAKYVGALAVDRTAGKSDAAACQTAILDVLHAHADDQYWKSAPSEQALWSWRLKDSKGMFGAAQAQLAQEDKKLGAFWQGQNSPNPSEWARSRALLDASSRLLTAFAMGK